MEEKCLVEKGKVYTADIIDLGTDGEGIGKINGFTVFVAGAFPGTRLRHVSYYPTILHRNSILNRAESQPMRTFPIILSRIARLVNEKSAGELSPALLADSTKSCVTCRIRFPYINSAVRRPGHPVHRSGLPPRPGGRPARCPCPSQARRCCASGL